MLLNNFGEDEANDKSLHQQSLLYQWKAYSP